MTQSVSGCNVRTYGTTIELGVMTIDAVNHETWTTPATLAWFAQHSGWTDEGERRALEAVADEIRGKRLLDIGVGGGRTVPILRALSDDYVGVDYLEPMVAACRERFPGVRVEWADARHLTQFDDGAFDFAMFSWNGIDAVDHDGRPDVLREVHRVLAPGGIFLFSTLNELGPAARQRPWRLDIGKRDLRHPVNVARRIGSVPVDLVNHVRLRSHEVHGEGWSMRNLSAHHYGIIAHFTTYARQLDELRDTGFELIEARHDWNGDPVVPSDDITWDVYFQLLARKV